MRIRRQGADDYLRQCNPALSGEMAQDLCACRRKMRGMPMKGVTPSGNPAG